MSMIVTIPQLFYDLIARVLPGYLFLIMLRVSLYGTGFSFEQFEIVQSVTSVGAILNGLSLLVVCYFVGWMLRSVSLRGVEHVGVRLLQEGGARPDLSEMATKFLKIRLKNETVGFRIRKLGAEARMFEASRTGMCLIFFISALTFLLSRLSANVVPQQPNRIWLLKLGLPFVMALAFHKLLRPACVRYGDNIIKHYEILFGDEK